MSRLTSERRAPGRAPLAPADRQQAAVKHVLLVGGGGAQVQVNINNNSGGEVTTSERKGPNGQRFIDVEIGRSIGSGRQDAVLRRFGNRPAPVKR